MNFQIRNLTEGAGILFLSLNDRIQYLKNSRVINHQTYLKLKSILQVNLADVEFFNKEEKSSHFSNIIEVLQELKPLSERHRNVHDFEVEMVLDSNSSYDNLNIKVLRATMNLISQDQVCLEFSDRIELKIVIELSHIDPVLSRQIIKIFKILNSNIPVEVHQLKKIDSFWKFQSIILFPDYLIDVTSVSEAYDPKGNSNIRQFINLFSPRVSTKSILIGTAVNEFLDELIVRQNISYNELIQNVFYKYALSLTALSEEEYLDFISQTKLQYDNLQKVLKDNFNSSIKDYSDCLLEPSFYSVEYGIQGRLDLLYQTRLQNLVVELKSGRPFNTNSEGISPSHHAQACLYLMLLNSVYGNEFSGEAFILYSALETHSLRKVLEQNSLQKKLIEIRNSLLLIHLYLSCVQPDKQKLFDEISEKSFATSNTFVKRDGIEWLRRYQNLDDTEKLYLKNFSYFISKEQLISKCGVDGISQGLASMWLMSSSEKELQYLLLSSLSIIKVERPENDTPIIYIQSLGKKSSVSQFRIGDSLILYPQTKNGKGMLSSLVYKCTLIGQSKDQFQIRLRGRQFRPQDEKIVNYWCLESDNLDRPFLYQYSNLYEWMSASGSYRKLILGRFSKTTESKYEFVNEDNDSLCKRIVMAEDFFLLWGPPGSGKTSVILKRLLELLIDSSKKSFLVLAYTNRAVDEICSVLDQHQIVNDYIRIGSRYGTSSQFHNKLLDHKVKTVKNRTELKALLNNTRIFTATIASIQGKPELFKLKEFDSVIIDEASQVLEPNLIGLLSRFRKFILIGDHLQLPAVSIQSDEDCKIQNVPLNQLGFEKTNESLFERLFRQCRQANLFEHLGMLQKQGRMHDELMQFPSINFYENSLKTIEADLLSRQNLKLELKFHKKLSQPFLSALSSERRIFIDSDSSVAGLGLKRNIHEAQIITQIITYLQNLYALNEVEWNLETCGIITPFRAQISTIHEELIKERLNEIPLTIDTVERYQGSARDIIIISTCIQQSRQLEQISSITRLGVDRKLNVALTRAKEQIILIGNRKALSASDLYRKLIDEYTELDISLSR
ncbi:MAG: AAA family ATPase [Saprospiraceae bacterium]|nr:AAA family ATPase [Saprospiraceae bacterium]